MGGCHAILPLKDRPLDGGVDQSTDLAPDQSKSDARFVLGPVEAMGELNHPNAWETDPVLTNDGLTIYFSSSRIQGTEGDVFTAIRATKAAPFAPPVPVVGLNSSKADIFAVNGDNTIGVLATGDIDALDLWIGTRTPGLPWSYSQLTLITELNTTHTELDPKLSQDGLRLFYAPRGFKGAKDQQLVWAERPDLTTPFDPPKLLLGSHASSVDADPALSADERVLVFTSPRAGGKGANDLWFATRPDRDSPFGAPKPLADLNTAAYERDAFLTADGEWIYFTSTNAPKGQQDIFRAQILAWP